MAAAFGSGHHSAFPSTYYLAFFNGDPDASGTEPNSTGNYARLAVTNNDTNWDTPSTGQAENLIDLYWPTSSAGYQSGHQTLTWVGAFDNAAAGNRFWKARIKNSGGSDSSILIDGANLTPFIAIGDLVVTQVG